MSVHQIDEAYSRYSKFMDNDPLTHILLSFTHLSSETFYSKTIDDLHIYFSQIQDFAETVPELRYITFNFIERLTERYKSNQNLIKKSFYNSQTKYKVRLENKDQFLESLKSEDVERQEQKAIENLINLNQVSIDALEMMRSNLILKFSSQNQPSDEVQLSELKRESYKIVLLQELGIVEHLRKRFFDLSNPDQKAGITKMSELLSIMTGINSETLRRGIAEYKTNKRQDIYTRSAVIEVQKILLEVGIDLPLSEPQKKQ